MHFVKWEMDILYMFALFTQNFSNVPSILKDQLPSEKVLDTDFNTCYTDICNSCCDIKYRFRD